MAAAQQKRIAPEHDDEARTTRLRRLVQDFTRYGNDNLQPGSVEELSQSKRRTWEMFARWLMLGGVLFALILIAVLTFVYSRYS
jgi:hypothetical protein